MLTCIGTNLFAYDAYIDGIYYNFKGTDAVVTYLKQNSSNNSSAYSGNVIIPETVNYNGESYDVTSIDNYAFYCCSEVTSVTIGDNVVSIGDYAFEHCTSLSSIYFPNSVTSIGYSAFTNTLWYDNQSNGLVYAGKVAYRYKGTMPTNSSITIKDGTLGIAFYAFANFTGLKSITIPNSVTTIGAQAFIGCSNLQTISIPNSVTTILGHPFNGTAWYDNQPDGLVYTGKVAYRYKGTMPDNTSITIKNGTLGIAAGAFGGKTGLVSIIIPNSVTTICDGAFRGCTNLVSITNSDNLHTIGQQSFEDCSSLTSINIPTSLTSIGIYTFSGCSSLASLSIPNSITFIDDYAFQNCSSLDAINIPKSVKFIGRGAFYNCSNVESITIPNNVNVIGWFAFNGTKWYDSQADGLVYIGKAAYRYKGTMPNNSTIKLKEGTTSISYGAFTGCSGLSSITIPASIRNIGSQAFSGCKAVSIKLKNMNPINITSSVFYDQLHKNFSLYVPYGAKATYESAEVWKDFKEILETTLDEITISANNIATYCSIYDLDFTGVTDLKAYIASGFSPSTGELTLTRVYKVPAGEGLLLKGDEGDYEIPYTTTDMVYSNLLKGVTTTTELSPTDGTYTNFILANGSHGIGFYTLSASGNIAANKAYLQIPTSNLSSPAASLTLIFDDEANNEAEVTGIDCQKINQHNNNVYYNLRGQAVSNPTKGLYILNNKKVLIK